MHLYKGACHCGAIQFEIDTAFTEFTQCDCSLCRKKNAVMTKVHESKFKLLTGEDALGTYQWNLKIAKHHFCTKCGIYTFHRKRSDPDHFGINVFCLDESAIEGVPVIQVDGKSMSSA